MKNTKKFLDFKDGNVNSTFTGTKMTLYAGLSPIMKYLRKESLGAGINKLFPTVAHNATKFSIAQLMLSVVLASFSGINRLSRISVFTHDELVKVLLGLKKGLNKDVISQRFKQLGQRGAILLHEFHLGKVGKWLEKSGLESITIDVDSTVSTVYGNQEGAAKGFNSQKKGAKSYHSLLAFCSEMKLVVNTWFRTGSAYTGNGVCEFVKQIRAGLPATLGKVFFRADSGFFSGALFDLLEELGWTYLVKVKFKGMKKIFQTIQYTESEDGVAHGEFEYQAKGWKKTRVLKVLRTIEKWEERDFLGEKEMIPVYQYACYCSNLEGKDAVDLHELYKERSTSETWIEQVKSQLLAGKTLTDDFHANDMLWQLNVMAYNLSVMMRYKFKKLFRQEHATFRDWFIRVAAKITYGAGYIKQQIYEHYYEKEKWRQFSMQLA